MALIEDCMKVCFYRDKKATDEIRLATITHAAGINFEAPYRINTAQPLEAMHNRNNEFFRPYRMYQ